MSSTYKYLPLRGSDPEKGRIRNFLDKHYIDSSMIAVGGGTVLLAAGITAFVLKADSNQRENIRDGLTEQVQTKIVNFDKVADGWEDATPTNIFTDHKLGKILLSNGEVCHVEYRMADEDALFPDTPDVISFGDCPTVNQ